MNDKRTLFWNVDTQEDFIDPAGKLYVPGAEQIRPVLQMITDFAKDQQIRVISTCDYHHDHSAELSAEPDFKTSFPPHCMAGTWGAGFIDETMPDSPLIIDWENETDMAGKLEKLSACRNIVIRKDAFDVFAGNPYTRAILKQLGPEQVFVYGVTTNVCVDKAVTGLIESGIKVFVFADAIRELPGLPLPFDAWKTRGVELIDFAKSGKFLKELFN